MVHLRLPSLCVVLAATFGCASPEQVWVPPVSGLVPSSGGSAWLFDATGASHDTYEPVLAPGGAGELRAIAKDQSSGYAAALYDGALAVVDVENDLVEWHIVTLPTGHASLDIGASRIGAVTGKSAAILDASTGKILDSYDLTGWLKSFSLQRADALLPLADGGFVLIASRLPAAFQDGRVVVQRIDASRGEWELMRGEGDVAGLTRLGATTSVSETIYLAGVREQLARGAGQSRGSLHQTVVAYRYDPGTGTSRQIVEEHQIAIDPRILDVAAGRDPATDVDLLAILNATGELKVYDVLANGVTSAARYRNTFPGATRTAWVTPTRIAVALDTGDVKFVDITR